MNLSMINALNDDCIVNIFQYLSVKEKIILERVCKRFNVLSKLSWSNIKKCDLSWGNFKFENVKIPNAAVDQILDRCSRYLENICIYFANKVDKAKNE